MVGAMATEASYQQMHLFQLGGALFGAPGQDDNTASLMAAITAAMPAIWDVARTKVTFRGSLPYLAKIDAIDLLMGQVRAAVDASLGPLSLKQSQLFRNLSEMRKAAQEELVRKEMQVAKGYRPATGPIIARAPVEVVTARVRLTLTDGVWVATVERTAQVPDPNSPARAGDPLIRTPYDYDPAIPPR